MITNGYAALADVRSELRIEDVVDDARIERAIEAASRMIDTRCARRFWLDATPTKRLFEPQGSMQALVDDIGDATIVVRSDANGDGVFDVVLPPAGIRPYPTNAAAVGRPITMLASVETAFPSLLEVEARWGWPSVPTAVRHATIIQAVALFKRSGTGDAYVAEGLGQMRTPPMAAEAFKLIAPYRREVFA